jgi:DNA integrity scanning protein DisA with diadenylate cyclase activity
MENYRFTNFEEIDQALNVLEVKKQVQYYKVKGAVLRFREQLTVANVFKYTVNVIGEKIKASTSLKEMIFRFLWNKVKPEETAEEA